jgi:hypothetical protein
MSIFLEESFYCYPSLGVFSLYSSSSLKVTDLGLRLLLRLFSTAFLDLIKDIMSITKAIFLSGMPGLKNWSMEKGGLYLKSMLRMS